MDKQLFKNILKPQIDARTFKNETETGEAIAKAYDKALKSRAFSQSGQKFLSSNISILETSLKQGFKLNSLTKKKSSDLEPGWSTMALGFFMYWTAAKFNLVPPSPPAASTTNVIVVFPGNAEELARKLKIAFNQDTVDDFIEMLSSVLIGFQSKITGQYIGVSVNGAPVIIPWVGVFGDKPNDNEDKKKPKIELLSKSTWIPISKPQGYSVKFIDGPFGKYASRFDSKGNKIIPSTNTTNLIKANQINGRLSWDVLVDIKGEPGLLERNAGNAYLKMKEDASLDGVSIKFNSLISGYRPLGKPGDLKLRRNGSLKHKTQWAAREDYDDCMFDNGGGDVAKENCKKRFAMPTFKDRGTSNHGWGRSLDMGWINQNTKGQQWIRENGWKYGWYWGEQMDEEWHFTWVLDGNIPQNAGIGTFYIRDVSGKLEASDNQ
jgi:LAS superfamily LD-carboxypeptidase LdcB